MLRQFIFALFLICCAAVRAEEHNEPPNFLGRWTGEAEFMLEAGQVSQIHRFDIIEQQGVFVRGEHYWSAVNDALASHDGESYKFEATEPFLGVLDVGGRLHLVESGDTTYFEMQLVDKNTIDFIALEGGVHPLVGHGRLSRDK